MNHKQTTLFTVMAALAISTYSAQAQNQMMDDTMGSKGMTIATSGTFKGVEVNGGKVMVVRDGKRLTLKASADFKVPNTPAPHWQIVDRNGNTYLLKQLKIAGDKKNLSVEVPNYIRDIAKVQIWCSFAEVNLGEASFAKPVGR
ncbi:MAG: hypothetical protein SFX74_13380 [Fimbriimonadaceae bacterium]|nr:hypothetical protein [Fimbriimonadaceae bacterium]